MHNREFNVKRMVTTAVAECVMSGAGRAATAEMKVHVSVIALAASLLANAGPISAEKVLVYGQEASLIHEGAILLADTFKTSSDVWGKVSNYANGLKFTYGDDGLTISNNTGGKDCDTAWGLTSKPLILPKDVSAFTLAVTMRSAQKFFDAKGGDSYSNKIRWMDDEGNEVCPSTQLKFDTQAGRFITTTLSGLIPVNATRAVLSLGADSPNIIAAAESMTLRDVSFQVYNPKNATYATSGTMICGPVNAKSGTLTWSAEVPEGTSLSLQVATYKEGEALTFVGPDGTEKSSFTQSGTAIPKALTQGKVLVRATFSGNGKATPVLQSVKVAGQSAGRLALRSTAIDPMTLKVVQKTRSPLKELDVPLQVLVTDDYPIRWDTLKLVLDDKDITQNVIREGGLLTFLPMEGQFTEGVHEFILTLKNPINKSLAIKQAFFRGTRTVPQAHRVTLRDDGMTLVNGKPFFPIGIYSVCKREFNGMNLDKAFKDLKAVGFNFAHTYGTTLGAEGDEFIAAAEKYGFKLFISPGNMQNIAKRLENPGVLAWYIGDDTSAHQRPEDLIARNTNIKRIDPYRFTCQADAIGSMDASNYFKYIEGTDVFLPEIYPVHEDTPETARNCVAKVIRDMKVFHSDIKRYHAAQVKAGKTPEVKGCWPIIQHFQGWGWKRFPTREELRAMSYASIAAGAHGITWYTYGGFPHPEKDPPRIDYGITSSPKVWGEITEIAKELSGLQEVLCARNVEVPVFKVAAGPDKDVLGNASLTVMAKRHDRELYVFAVNSVLERISATFEFEHLVGVKEHLTGKDIAFTGKGFSEDFEPYGVRIFVVRIGGQEL